MMLRSGILGLAMLTVVGAANTVYLPIVSRQVAPVQTAPATFTATATFVPVPTATSPAAPTTPATATSTQEPPTATATFTSQPPSPTATSATALYDCSADIYNCSSFNTWAEAQACFDYCYPIAGDIHRLDQDGDLIACESMMPLFELWNST